MCSFMCLLWANCRSGDRVQDDRACREQALVTRCAVTRHVPAGDRYAVEDRYVAAGRCGGLALQIAAFHGEAQVETRAAPNVVQGVAPNAVRKFSWDDLIESPVALAVAPVRAVVPAVTQVSAWRVVQGAARCVARDY